MRMFTNKEKDGYENSNTAVAELDFYALHFMHCLDVFPFGLRAGSAASTESAWAGRFHATRGC